MYDPLLGYAIQFVDVGKIINHYLPDWREGSPIECPFHSESQPSLSLSLHPALGVFGQCFGCGEKIKHVWDLCKKLERKGSWREWAEYWYKVFVPIIDIQIIQSYVDSLGKRADLSTCTAYLMGPLRGLSEETIRESQIGYDKKTDRITIPIPDAFGNCVNIRKFRWKKGQKGPKAISHSKGCGEARLYPEQVLREKRFYLVEGEFDALLLSQHGLPAVSWTCGTLSWNVKFEPLLEDKEILVRYDSDPGGKKGEDTVRSHLDALAKQGHKISYRIVPPPAKARGKDISDWINDNPSVVEYFRHEFKRKKILVRPPTYKEIHDLFHQYFYIEDPYYIDFFFAVLVANRFMTDRVWALIVGPPGSLKTEVIRTIGGCSYVEELSEITGQTLLSGYRAGKHSDVVPSLILELDRKIISYKEFNSVLTAPFETRQKIFEQFRRIHDAKIEARYGSGMKHDWHGHIGFIGGCTNLIDGAISLQATLGERFILYRLIINDRRKAAIRAIENLPNTEKIRTHLQEKVIPFLEQYSDPPTGYILPTKEDHKRLIQLSEIICTGRTGVQKQRIGGGLVVTAEPAPEIPTRIARSLTLLGQGLAFIRKKKKFDNYVWNVLTKVAKDCMMQVRQNTLFYIADNGPVDLIQIHVGTRKDRKSCFETIKDLWYLGLIEEITMDNMKATHTIPVNEVLSSQKRYSLWQTSKLGKSLVEGLRK
jgi:hypothetical protein